MENIKNISIKNYLDRRGITPKSERGETGMKTIDKSALYSSHKDLN